SEPSTQTISSGVVSEAIRPTNDRTDSLSVGAFFSWSATTSWSRTVMSGLLLGRECGGFRLGRWLIPSSGWYTSTVGWGQPRKSPVSVTRRCALDHNGVTFDVNATIT